MYHSRFLVLIMLSVALLASACTSAATATPAPAATAQQQQSSAPAQPVVQPSATATTALTNTPAPTATSAPTATPAPAQGAACLVMASWQLADMSDYFTGVMSQAGSGAKVASQTGTITYVFGNDGVASVEADNFKLTLAVDVQGTTINIVVSINGHATANFTLSDPDKITFSHPQMGDLTFSATMNGTELLSGTPDELAAMFGISPDPKYNTFAYDCSGDTLKYTPPVKNAKPLLFKRVP